MLQRLSEPPVRKQGGQVKPESSSVDNSSAVAQPDRGDD